MSETLICPRCKGADFTEVDCGPDGWEDDITYTSDVCKRCGLWLDGWNHNWYADVQSWRDVEDIEPWSGQRGGAS